MPNYNRPSYPSVALRAPAREEFLLVALGPTGALSDEALALICDGWTIAGVLGVVEGAPNMEFVSQPLEPKSAFTIGAAYRKMIATSAREWRECLYPVLEVQA